MTPQDETIGCPTVFVRLTNDIGICEDLLKIKKEIG